MRIALFGSGSPLSTMALEALTSRFEVGCVVVPSSGAVGNLRQAVRALRRSRARRPLARLARRLGVPVLRYRRDREDRLLASLAALKPDLICVASFPSLLKPPVLRLPRLGCLGIHHSLLPRHRGPDPIFWTYSGDDAEAGVTVFWLDDGEDTGDVLSQEVVGLPRGQDGTGLYHDLSRRGCALLLRAVEDVRDGRATRTPQDEGRTTREPAPAEGNWRIDFETWGAERVWHFLRGVGAAGGILADSRGRLLTHGPARRFVLGSEEGTPGSVERTREGWRLLCRDGFVDVDPPSFAQRASRVARRVVAGL